MTMPTSSPKRVPANTASFRRAASMSMLMNSTATASAIVSVSHDRRR